MEKSILIVEDDEGIRVVVQDALISQGYHVVTAGNGKKGLGIGHSTQARPDHPGCDASVDGRVRDMQNYTQGRNHFPSHDADGQR